VSLRRRLALLSALAVAFAVLLASGLVYTLVRDRLTGDIDNDLRHQADLAKVGVTLVLKPSDPPQLAGLQYGVKYSGLAVGTALFGQVQPGVQFGSPYYGPLNNWSGFKDDRFRALATAMSTETAAARAKPAYADFSDYLLDQSFTITVDTSCRARQRRPGPRV